MRSVLLPDTDLYLSRLALGTGSLHHLRTHSDRQRLLSQAFEHGFRHFDTAPSYGFGIGECELGSFLKGRRDRAFVATKVGLYPPRNSRADLASFWMRKLGGKFFPILTRPLVDWSIAAAASSLRRSLRRMRTDRIDLLLLHEPVPNLIRSDEFVMWLTDEKQKGTIRSWGLAGEATGFSQWISNHPLGMVLQVRDSLDQREADAVTSHDRELQITYGYLSSAKVRSERRSVEDVLTGALRRNTTGTIIVATRRQARVAELAAIAEKVDAVVR